MFPFLIGSLSFTKELAPDCVNLQSKAYCSVELCIKVDARFSTWFLKVSVVNFSIRRWSRKSEWNDGSFCKPLAFTRRGRVRGVHTTLRGLFATLQGVVAHGRSARQGFTTLDSRDCHWSDFLPESQYTGSRLYGLFWHIKSISSWSQ